MVAFMIDTGTSSRSYECVLKTYERLQIVLRTKCSVICVPNTSSENFLQICLFIKKEEERDE